MVDYDGKTGTLMESSSVEDDLSGVSAGSRKLAGILSRPSTVISVIAIIIIALFVRSFSVPSGSMIPTLEVGDRIFGVARYFPNGSTYSRGDIVCFFSPSGDVYVKRVIGVGGDHIQISGEHVYVNGELSPWQGTGNIMSSMDVQLADDEYWVMGDNRANSQDSRRIGPVSASKVICKVYAIYFPFDRIKAL